MPFVHGNKTISLELDAYERLKAAKRNGESFSSVVRRAIFTTEPASGRDLLSRIRESRTRVQESDLEGIEGAIRVR